MGYFQRTGSSSIQYHNYVPESVSLINIGLGSYTRNSFKDFGYKDTDSGKQLDEDIKEYFNGPPPTTLLGDSEELFILHYDTENNRYILKSSRGTGLNNLFYSPSGGIVASSLADFQEKWDNVQKGFAKDIGLSNTEIFGINDVYYNIKNSLSGCITFKSKTYNVLSCDERTLVKIYLTSTGKTSTERKVANNGIPTFVVEPKDSAFQTYSHRATNSLPPGESVGVLNGGTNNPQNTVAAQPRYRYDNVSGKVEFGTFQTLAVLLEDLPGIDTPALPENIDLLAHDRYVLNEASTAKALPLTSHNGNPKIIAPNSYDCGGFKKQKILVTNITPRSYEKGDLVICSLVNGIWIPMGYKEPNLAPKFLKVEWSEMQKYIVNAHSFFRNHTNTDYITPDEYIQHFRYSYYTSNNDDPITNGLNIFNITSENEIARSGAKIVLKENDITNATNYASSLFVKKPVRNGYLSVCDADQIHTSLGGNNEVANFFTNTNLDQMQPDDTELGIVFAQSVPINWGMFFPKGYSSISTAKLRNYNGSISIAGSGTETGRAAIYTSGTFNFNRQTSFNIRDTNLYHLPAQIALNSKEKPTKNYSNFWNALFSQPYHSFTKQVNFGKNYGEYLIKSDGSDLYNLTPLSPNNIHFYPLQLELALADTYIDYGTNPSGTYNNKGYTNLAVQLSTGWNVILSSIREEKGKDQRSGYALGNMWKRNFIPSPIICKESNPKITSSIGFSDDVLLDHRTIPPKVVKDITNRPPVGGPNLFPHIHYDDERSNVVGILGAKATINLQRGGQLNLNTENRFGTRAYNITTIAGGGLVSTVLGSIAAFSQDLTGVNRDVSIKQWGATNEGNPNSFGTTALFCKIYDHYENTIYDARYFTPLHFNSSSGLEFDEPQLNINAIVDSNTYTNVNYTRNTIRNSKLLSGGGFSYIKKYIGIIPDHIQIINPGVGYQNGVLKLQFGGNNNPAIFKVKVQNGQITKSDIEIISHGEFSASVFSNPLPAKILPENEGEEILFNTEADIKVSTGVVMEKLMHDPEPESITVMLTPSSNKGAGDNKGIVTSTVSKSVGLNPNSTGKYDIFFFFVNDIIHTHLTNTSINAYDSFYPAANYVKLDISAG